MIILSTLLIISAMTFASPFINSTTAEETNIFKVITKLEKVKKILKSNPNAVNARKIDGSTPLHVIPKIKTFEVNYSSNLTGTAKKVTKKKVGPVAVLLVSKGANVNALDNGGAAPLHYAIAYNRTYLAEFLIENGANVNASVTKKKGLEGATPLHFAVGHQNIHIINLLISKGANVNAKTKKGQTLLHLASIYNSFKAATILIKAGAKITLKDAHGESPLSIAVKKNHEKIIVLLRQHGAK